MDSDELMIATVETMTATQPKNGAKNRIKSCLTAIPDDLFEPMCELVTSREMQGRKKVYSLNNLTDIGRRYWNQHSKEYVAITLVTFGENEVKGIETSDGRVLLMKTDHDKLLQYAVTVTDTHMDAYRLMKDQFHVSLSAVRQTFQSLKGKKKRKAREPIHSNTDTTDMGPPILQRMKSLGPKAGADHQYTTSSLCSPCSPSAESVSKVQCAVCWTIHKSTEDWQRHIHADSGHSRILSEMCPSTNYLQKTGCGLYCELCCCDFYDSPLEHVTSLWHTESKEKLARSKHNDHTKCDPRDEEEEDKKMVDSTEHAESSSSEGCAHSDNEEEEEAEEESIPDGCRAAVEVETICFCGGIGGDDLDELLKLRSILEERITELQNGSNGS